MNGWLTDQLPGHMADDDFLIRFLGIFEEIADGVRNHADGFDYLLDLSVTPPEFVRYLGSWIGARIDSAMPPDRQRQLARSAGLIFPWRGTTLGMTSMIESVTGSVAVVDDGCGVFAAGSVPANPKRVTVRVEHTGRLTEEQLRGLIEDELPIDVTYELIVGGDDRAAPPPPVTPPPPAATDPEDAAAGVAERVDEIIASIAGGDATEPPPAPEAKTEDPPERVQEAEETPSGPRGPLEAAVTLLGGPDADAGDEPDHEEAERTARDTAPGGMPDQGRDRDESWWSDWGEDGRDRPGSGERSPGETGGD